MVINYRSSTNITDNVTSLKDLENPIIDNIGQDVWDAIMYFHYKEIEELKDNSIYCEEDIRSYDVDLTALRSDVRDVIDSINNIMDYVNNTSRLKRSTLLNELISTKRTLEDSEGYL